MAVLSFLLTLYSTLTVGEKPPRLFRVICFPLIDATSASAAATTSELSTNTSTLSPTFKFDLSGSDLRSKLEPLIVSMKKRALVL